MGQGFAVSEVQSGGFCWCNQKTVLPWGTLEWLGKVKTCLPCSLLHYKIRAAV